MAPFRIHFAAGFLKDMEQVIARCHSAFHILQLKAVLLDLLHAEEICLPAHGKDQIIIGNNRTIGLDIAGLKIDRRDLAHQEVDIVVPAEDRPQGIGDLRGDQAGNGHLVQQRLEEVIVMAVDNRDLHGRARQFLCSLQATESRADNDNMRNLLDVHLSPSCL